MTLNTPFCVKFCFVPVCLELWSLTFEAWLFLNVMNVVGELWTEKNSCGIARFPCDSTAFLFELVQSFSWRLVRSLRSTLLHFVDSSVINCAGMVYHYLDFYWGKLSQYSFPLVTGELERLLAVGLTKRNNQWAICYCNSKLLNLIICIWALERSGAERAVLPLRVKPPFCDLRSPLRSNNNNNKFYLPERNI